jgi:hypothetical protein
MRADLRWNMVLLAGGLMLAPAPALAQSTTATPPSTQPTSNAIGPSELQNFSLSGSVTKPADQPPPASSPAATRPVAGTETAPAAPSPALRTPQARTVSQQLAQHNAAPAPKPPPVALNAPAPKTGAPLPVETNTAPAPASNAQPVFPSAAAPAEPSATLAPEHGFSILPWLLAAFVLAAATLFLLWRRRPREAVAGGPQFDLFVPPEPAPAPPPATPRPAAPRASVPQPAPPPPPPAAPAPRGIVSTRLRPTVELSVKPLRCVVDGERVVIDCELELFNSGAAPARALIAEASLFNAGATQEQDLAAFFANPVGAGERLDALPPMQRVTFASQVVAPRAAMHEYELAGRKALVPVLAFNALYQWSGGEAQTSAAYLVGRETKSDKLGPLGLKDGTHEFRKLAARALPTALRS